MVDSQSQIGEAVKIARASIGAYTVHDELTIEKQGQTMFKPLLRVSTAVALCVSALTIAPSAAQTAAASTGPVTVVVEVALAANTAPSDALVALNDMRAMMKKQPGYLSEEFLQNLNSSNAPRYVHVSRWASMAYWSALFAAPEFSKLSAHGNEHYVISASAFLPAE
jgi:heme-degrading monooxygenase HmoA